MTLNKSSSVSKIPGVGFMFSSGVKRLSTAFEKLPKSLILSVTFPIHSELNICLVIHLHLSNLCVMHLLLPCVRCLNGDILLLEDGVNLDPLVTLQVLVHGCINNQQPSVSYWTLTLACQLKGDLVIQLHFLRGKIK